MNTSAFVLLLALGGVIGEDDKEAKLRFYHGSMDNYTELGIGEADRILTTSSWYDSTRLTVIFTHGFYGHPKGPAVTAIIEALLEQEIYNLALLNWEKLAAAELSSVLSSYMHYALPNAIQLGMDFSETLVKLSSQGFDLNNTHFIGLSLGAHLFGITGNKMREYGLPLPWITGLDPAIGFEMKPAFMRLSPTSARFVSVIHTDPNKFGTRREIGFVDFWPNFRMRGPVLQPGCPETATRFSDEDFCSHNRALKYLVDSWKHPGTIKGSYAKNFRIWKKYNESQRKAVVLELGVRNDNAVPGNYFLTTLGESPYGLGDDGL